MNRYVAFALQNRICFLVYSKVADYDHFFAEKVIFFFKKRTACSSISLERNDLRA